MRLSRAPDLGTPGRMAAAALVATLVAVVILSLRDGANLTAGLGDTDDALRVVLMRGLLAGDGWYDQLILRLQPPLGLQMHWSRLIDGGLAALAGLFGLFTTPARAEYATRFVWPMLWIFPAALASLVSARRLAGGAAVLACAILLLTELSLYLQFRPGRVDHHNIQIVCCLIAFAGAGLGSVRGAVMSGLATGLGLAIGLEAMAFEIVIGAFFPLSFLFDRDPGGRRLRAFAIALAAATLVFFLVQTPPWRWSVVACDAIASNLTAAIVVAGAGLVATVMVTAEREWRWRLGALVVAGAMAAGVYLALDPHCLAGPFADVDPRLKSFWLQHVQEIRSIPRTWSREHETGYTLMGPCVFGALAWLWLGVDRARRTDPFWILSGVLLAAATFAGFSAIRMATYANWIAMPIVAAAVTDLVNRYLGGALLALAVGACAATPLYTSQAVFALDKQIKAATAKQPAVKPASKPPVKPAAKAVRPPAAPRGDRCFQAAAYTALAKQPAGLVLSEVDVGPFILAYTPHSAMAAPYHRMSWGLITARRVLSTEGEAAQVEARRLGFRYVLECAPHARNADRNGMKPDSLQKRLDANKPPSWLEPIGANNGVIRAYRIKPAADAPAVQAAPGLSPAQPVG